MLEGFLGSLGSLGSLGTAVVEFAFGSLDRFGAETISIDADIVGKKERKEHKGKKGEISTCSSTCGSRKTAG
jgi:hypothetical protein